MGKKWEISLLLGLLLFALSGGLGWVHRALPAAGFVLPQDYRMFSQVPDTRLWVEYSVVNDEGDTIWKKDSRNCRQWKNGDLLYDFYISRYHSLDHAYERYYYENYRKLNSSLDLKSFLERESEGNALLFIENLQNLGRFLHKESTVAFQYKKCYLHIYRKPLVMSGLQEKRFTDWVGFQKVFSDTLTLDNDE